MKKLSRFFTAILATSAVLLVMGSFSMTFAVGLTGDCYDCHTMHNSEQGQPVAQVGTNGTVSSAPIQNLLKFDCIACHANDPTGGDNILALDGGSTIPQVMHGATTDLAAGNFRYIAENGNRKGHNVVDLVSADSDNLFPPGHRHANASSVGDGKFDIDQFTCAGYMGCHGYRGQVLTSSTLSCDPLTGEKYIDGQPTGEQCDAQDYANEGTNLSYRTGLEALSGFSGFPTTSFKRGAHHDNYEGLKNDGVLPAFYDAPLANSYRFIFALRGYGNETDRWQNVDENSHNEYVGGYPESALGDVIKSTDFGTTATCGRCHFNGSINATTSHLYTPSSSMTGFCITCHGKFHSSGETNGSSGAFLRHPSDYVIPDRDEYAAYTSYDITAPVARPHSDFINGMSDSPTVTPGKDLVMCLSCHVAHASEHDYMLRFDYSETTAQSAGIYADQSTSQSEGGCLACHTMKGVQR